LQFYSFPGNVRELENILERAVALCEESVIQAADLRLPQRSDNPAANSVSTSIVQSGSPSNANPTALGAMVASKPTANASGDLENYIDNLQREAIMKALQETRYNKTKAAQVLGITFRALRYKLKKLGID
jgi:two-component system, NtrC family, response regulator PilR